MASYPPYGSQQPTNSYPSYPPSTNTHSTSFDAIKAAEDGRQISRTPSPTPSEERELRTAGAFDWRNLLQWSFWIRREWLCSSPNPPVHYLALTCVFWFYEIRVLCWRCTHCRPYDSPFHLPQTNCQFPNTCCNVDARVSLYSTMSKFTLVQLIIHLLISSAL
jgi:hypothetical protein